MLDKLLTCVRACGVCVVCVVPAGSFDSLPKLIVDSAFRCEPEIQAGLIANLIVTGGNSCFEGVSA